MLAWCTRSTSKTPKGTSETDEYHDNIPGRAYAVAGGQARSDQVDNLDITRSVRICTAREIMITWRGSRNAVVCARRRESEKDLKAGRTEMMWSA